MTLLNRYFSDEHLAKTAELADEDILRVWKAYRDTIPEKADIIAKLSPDTCYKYGPRLKELLSLELADIAQEEKDEDAIVADLDSLEHRDRMKRIVRLEECLHHAKSAHEYVHGLLANLFSVLKAEWHLVNKLSPNFIAPLVKEFENEKAIIDLMERIGGKKENFHKFFRALVRGEHIVHRMDKGEKRLFRTMDARMKGIFEDIRNGVGIDAPEGVNITGDWVNGVCNAIKVRVQKAVEEGTLELHVFRDDEFVARPEFVDLVREAINYYRGEKQKKPVSEKMINVFVQIFREWYFYESKS